MNGPTLKAAKSIVLCLAASLLLTSGRLGFAAPSASGGSSFWIPFFAQPWDGTAGKNGLFVIASNEITSSPAPKWITTKPVQFIAAASSYGASSLDRLPALLVYSTAVSTGEVRLYGLNLTNTATVPKPVQIGSLSIEPATGEFCGASYAQTNLREPESLFIVLGFGTGYPDGCSLPTTQKIVHYTDSPSTPPQDSSLPAWMMDPLYLNGTFRGAFAIDFFAQETYLYTSELTYSMLVPGEAFPTGIVNINDGSRFGEDVVYLEEAGASGSTLYRIDAKTLTLSTVGTPGAFTGGPISDGTNVYFIDSTSSTSNQFYQAPVAGGPPKLLYTAPFAADSTYSLIESSSTDLVFQYATVPLSGGNPNYAAAKGTIYKIPVGRVSASAVKIGGPYEGLATGFIGQASSSDKSTAYLTIVRQLGSRANFHFKYSSVSIPLAGPYTQTPVANSAYGGWLIYNSALAFWQVTGITDTGGWGGGTVSMVDLATGTKTIFTTTGGKDFVMPDGLTGFLGEFFGTNLADGTLYPIATQPPPVGVAADLTHHFLYTLSLANTDVSSY